MNVSTTDALGVGAAAGAGGASAGTTVEKEAFLKLLVAQISNQDPLSPQDSEQYIQQLTQFSTLEQLMTLNSGVETLAVGQLSNNNQEAMRFVGREVVAKGNALDLEAGTPAEVSYAVAGEGAQTVTIVITDDSGHEVHRKEVPAPSGGRGTYSWDGTNDDGDALPSGRYGVSIEAANSEGDGVPVDTMVRGRITGVRFDNGYPELLMGDRRVRLSDIQEVQ